MAMGEIGLGVIAVLMRDALMRNVNLIRTILNVSTPDMDENTAMGERRGRTLARNVAFLATIV
jgi:hypothetical protein